MYSSSVHFYTHVSCRINSAQDDSSEKFCHGRDVACVGHSHYHGHIQSQTKQGSQAQHRVVFLPVWCGRRRMSGPDQSGPQHALLSLDFSVQAEKLSVPDRSTHRTVSGRRNH
uniref:Uncharacterized protein n=1 Tax=Cacopsylla melanoneura TaxID=428564 RepID=A0A8D8QYH3_9HEMI